MSDQKFPKGWDQARIKDVLEHYDGQSDEEAVVEDEAAAEDKSIAYVAVPRELVDEVQELIRRKTGTEG